MYSELSFSFQEQNEFEENNLYKQYVEKRDRFHDYHHYQTPVGSSLNKLALGALNAVNVISQDDNTSRVAFV